MHVCAPINWVFRTKCAAFAMMRERSTQRENLPRQERACRAAAAFSASYASPEAAVSRTRLKLLPGVLLVVCSHFWGTRLATRSPFTL